MQNTILNNAWFIAFTVGTLLATLAALTRKIARSGRKSREYLLSINHANRELLESVQRRMSEGNSSLTRELIASLTRAAAMQNRVRITDLYSLDEVVDGMNMYLANLPFLKPRQKEQLLEQLATFKEQEAEKKRFEERSA